MLPQPLFDNLLVQKICQMSISAYVGVSVEYTGGYKMGVKVWIGWVGE